MKRTPPRFTRAQVRGNPHRVTFAFIVLTFALLSATLSCGEASRPEADGMFRA